MARRGFFRRVLDVFFPPAEPVPQARPEPSVAEPPPHPRHAHRTNVGGHGDDWYDIEAQKIWDDVASDIMANPNAEEPFLNFIRAHLRDWSGDQAMPREETRTLISWMILHAHDIIGHDDITAVLDRIYQAMYMALS